MWAGPTLVLLVAVVCGFLFWTVRSQSGTSWIVQTAVQQLGGDVQGIRGTLWRGVSVQTLKLDMPAFSLDLAGAHVQVDWPELLERRLHVVDLSAQSIRLDLHTAAAPEPDTGPFHMPALPVAVAVDRLAVGRFALSQDGKAAPVDVSDLDSSLSVAGGGAQLVLANVAVSAQAMHVRARGEVRLQALRKPWPLTGRLGLTFQGQGADSPLCVRRYVPDLPAGGQGAHSAGAADCAAQVDVTAAGNLDELNVSLTGGGQGLNLDAQASLTPLASFPLRSAAVGLKLADGSSLQGKFDWVTTLLDGAAQDRVTGSIQTRDLNLGVLAGASLPAATLTATANFDARLADHSVLRAASVDVDFAKGSSWNKQALSGRVAAKVSGGDAPVPVVAGQPAADRSPLLHGLGLDSLDVDLRLGGNRIQAKGSLGQLKSRLDLDVKAPDLAAFWPGLRGAAQASGRVAGTLASHSADLELSYQPQSGTPGPGKPKPSKPQPGKAGHGGQPGTEGLAPIHARLALTGRWGSVDQDGHALPGWQGRFSTLDLGYDGLSARILAPLTVAFAPDAAAPQWQWQVGAVDIRVSLPQDKAFVLRHQGSRGGSGWWDTQGSVGKLALSRRLIRTLYRLFQPRDRGPGNTTGRVSMETPAHHDDVDLVFAADWNVKFKGVLTGQARIRRISGDIRVPGEPSFPLGLKTFELDVAARPRGAAASALEATLDLSTEKMGRLSAKGTAVLKTSGPDAWTLDTSAPQAVQVNADIADLGWLDLFLGDQTEVGGSLTVDARARSGPGGTWSTGGTISGKDIKFVRVDDGVRMFNGTLKAHLDGSQLILDALRFPSVLRVAPKEWRTAEWVSKNPDAQNGNLTVTGRWDLFKSQGVVDAKLYRFPILQRSDRYAMLTGKLSVDARPEAIAITGDVTADAGWFDLDVLGSVPTVDSDVVVIRPGQEQSVQVPSDITLDMQINLGPRFYLTGYGVDSGLVGSMHILMSGNKLTGVGQLRTRGGSIDVYGQHLQLRQGTVTFQGNIADPVLSIEALRTGVAVRAGVHVGGTAKRPQIKLVSYPDVSEVEKLSWLLLGRAPDEGGGDAALLFSVGSSFLGGGEPLYRKFGLDELSIRTGELGSTGSILPPQSVVSDSNQNPSTLEQQFAVASKHLGHGVTLSLEQALAETGTVGRLSYKLSRRLRAELSAGTVNGIALIYHVFFDD